VLVNTQYSSVLTSRKQETRMCRWTHSTAVF
jgi:hypothetical protein